MTASNRNPVVHRGPCIRCGQEVAVFAKDVTATNDLSRLAHFGACPVTTKED